MLLMLLVSLVLLLKLQLDLTACACGMPHADLISFLAAISVQDLQVAMILWGSPRKPSFEHGASDAKMVEGWMVYWMNVEYSLWLRQKRTEQDEEDMQREQERANELDSALDDISIFVERKPLPEHIKQLHDEEDDNGDSRPLRQSFICESQSF